MKGEPGKLQNWEVAAALERMAGLLALKGENDFKVRAYSQAARQVIRLSEPLAVLIDEGRLDRLPGIGKALRAKIEELVATGQSAFLARLENEVPPELLALFAIPGVGYKTAAALVQGLRLSNMGELERAAQNGRVRSLPGLGGALERNIIAYFQERSREQELFHRGVAVPLAEQLRRYLEELPLVKLYRTAGEVRRGKEAVAAVEGVAVLSPAGGREALIRALRGLPWAASINQAEREEGPLHLETLFGLPVSLHLVSEEAFPAALVKLTASAEHWERLAGRAREFGFTLTGEGLRDAAGRGLPLHAEEDLYRALELPFIPPELREDEGEWEAALSGRLPVLLEAEQIRGDLHLHSDWSDGTASLEAIAAAASAMGYAYAAITDHSPALRIAGGLTPEKLRLQCEAIRHLNETNGGCYLFTGMEVNINSDGSLDLPDKLLAGLELVVASVHSNFRQSRAEMTGRLCRAMEHPSVHIIGHPTGRLLGSRGGYQVDEEALIRQAAATGTIIEINASPQRLDLPEAHIRRARDAGVRLAVSTDAHSIATMEDMPYGVTAARRGWLEAGQVVNTLPLPELRALLRKKQLSRKG